MLTRPLEQFEIVPLLPFGTERLDLSLTNRGLFALLVVFGLTFFYRSLGVVGNGALIPNRWQVIAEEFYGMSLAMITESAGEEGKKYFPFIFTLFSFLLACNLIGLIPYRFTVTSHAIVTITLALGIWVGKLIVGVRHHGVALLGMFLPAGVPFAMVPFLVAIELLGFCIVAVRLPVRLFANMMAGHILLKVLGGFAWTMMMAGGVLYLAHFLPLGVLFLLMGLETGVALIQAYVFTILTCLYLGDMIHGGH